MRAIKILVFLALTCLCASRSFAMDLAAHPEVQRYIQTISDKYNFDPAQLSDWFNQIDYLQIKFISKPASAKAQPYYAYRNLLITPARVRAGVAYWQQHRTDLLAAQQRYGVPATVIVGILGVETTYGTNMGTYSAFRALASEAFQNQRRSAFFTNELTEYLLLCREQGWHPLTVRSSYAGAIGMPQFMPSSYRQYAVSTGRFRKNADLLHNDQDVIASIAYYLRAKGWQPNQPVALRAQASSQNAARFMDRSDAPLRLAQWQQHQVTALQKADSRLAAYPIMLQGENGIERWLAFKNFSVIKSYNNSTDYAMTVYQLGNIIATTAEKNLQG